MAAKKKKPTKKKIVRHDDSFRKTKVEKKAIEKTEEEPDKPKISERTREKDAGFGVIKIVVGIITVLIVASMILFNSSSGRDSDRGSKVPGELCEDTTECKKGTICYSYQGNKRCCMTQCNPDKTCDPGYACVTAAEQKPRQGFRITDVCVEDAER